MASATFIIRAMLGIGVLGVLFWGTLVLGGEEPANLVSNGGFEVKGIDNNGPANWDSTPVAELKDFFSCEWDSTTSHSGQRSASISIEENHPDRQVFYSWNQAPLNCTPGDTYKLTGWAKAQDLNEPAFIVVQCWDTGMKKVLGRTNIQDMEKVVGATDWIPVEAVFKVPADTWRVVVLAGIPGHSNLGGKVWFDDLAVTQVQGD